MELLKLFIGMLQVIDKLSLPFHMSPQIVESERRSGNYVPKVWTDDFIQSQTSVYLVSKAYMDIQYNFSLLASYLFEIKIN